MEVLRPASATETIYLHSSFGVLLKEGTSTMHNDPGMSMFSKFHSNPCTYFYCCALRFLNIVPVAIFPSTNFGKTGQC